MNMELIRIILGAIVMAVTLGLVAILARNASRAPVTAAPASEAPPEVEVEVLSAAELDEIWRKS